MSSRAPINIPKWKQRTADTHQVHLTELRSKNQDEVQTLFIGSSMFERFHSTGKRFLAEFKPFRVYIAGVGGDGIQHMLYRVENGLLEACPTSLATVVLSAGTNNIEKYSSQEVCAATVALISNIFARKPKVQILLFGIAPRASTVKHLSDLSLMARIKELNSMLAQLPSLASFSSRLWYFDPATSLLDLRTGLYDKKFFDDHVHYNVKGYREYTNVLLQALAKHPPAAANGALPAAPPDSPGPGEPVETKKGVFSSSNNSVPNEEGVTLYTIGYAGWKPEQMKQAVLSLATRAPGGLERKVDTSNGTAAGVSAGPEGSILADIRFTPFSRSKEWCKPALELLMRECNYMHLHELGNRTHHQGGTINLVDVQKGYEKLLPFLIGPSSSLKFNQGDINKQAVVLMCGCKSHESCHRTAAAQEIACLFAEQFPGCPPLRIMHLYPNSLQGSVATEDNISQAGVTGTLSPVAKPAAASSSALLTALNNNRSRVSREGGERNRGRGGKGRGGARGKGRGRGRGRGLGGVSTSCK
mmetsp:Transcript_26201/g.51675  ORF Transcript_26201/g.51675 Transcript_26201/m.51675 type:complete len:530 (+) Transcript_26201:74-1663(+)